MTDNESRPAACDNGRDQKEVQSEKDFEEDGDHANDATVPRRLRSHFASRGCSCDVAVPYNPFLPAFFASAHRRFVAAASFARHSFDIRRRRVGAVAVLSLPCRAALTDLDPAR